MSKSIKVLVVDDHQMFIDGIKAILKNNSGIIISGEALNGVQAVNILETQRYDIVIADIEMPEMDGIELTRHIKHHYPEIRVLIVTSHIDRSFIEETLCAQADGYILKNTSKKELIDAITRVYDGGGYFSNEIVSVLSSIKKEKIKKEKETVNLTEREKEIIRLICKEFPNTEIAEKLCISTFTVETHRKNIYKKSKAKSIVGLIKFAIENDLA